MPLYEYACDACGHRFERIQKFSDPLVTVCPSCGGAVRKLISSPAIQFKGAGWYVNDYAKAGAKSNDSTSGDSKAETKKESGGEAKADGGSGSQGSEKAPKEAAKSETPAKAPASGGTGPSTKP